jgi:hypothetical protein
MTKEFDEAELAKYMRADPGSYNAESAYLLQHLDEYITRNFGKRCSEYEAGCAICEIWAKRDDLAEFICGVL